MKPISGQDLDFPLTQEQIDNIEIMVESEFERAIGVVESHFREIDLRGAKEQGNLLKNK